MFSITTVGSESGGQHSCSCYHVKKLRPRKVIELPAITLRGTVKASADLPPDEIVFIAVISLPLNERYVVIAELQSDSCLLPIC